MAIHLVERETRAAKPIRVAIFVGLVCGFWFFVANPSRASQLPSYGEQDVLPSPCATDPDFREFEKLQADAYQTDKALDFRIVLSPDFQDDVAKKTINVLRDRSHERNMVYPVTPGILRDLQAEMTHIKTPTCYENRAYYYLIRHIAYDATLASFEIGLPLEEPPKFGSLPSNDINAYTYLTRRGQGRIIAINAQLFNFISKMTKLAASGVDLRMGREMDSEARIVVEGLLDISYNQNAKDAFVNSVLGLLRGRPIAKIPVEPSKEAFVAFFEGAMERFVFAHEYGHIIKHHVSPKIFIPMGATGNEEHEVLARTWKQEFEADVIGSQLLIQLLRGGGADNPDARSYYAFGMKSPLFFFECMELLDRARFILENRTMPPVLSEEDKALVRSCADRTMSPAASRCAVEVLGTHPPAWLRRERLEKVIKDTLAQQPNRKVTALAAQKADEMIFSIDLFWRATSRQLLEQIVKQANGN